MLTRPRTKSKYRKVVKAFVRLRNSRIHRSRKESARDFFEKAQSRVRNEREPSILNRRRRRLWHRLLKLRIPNHRVIGSRCVARAQPISSSDRLMARPIANQCVWKAGMTRGLEKSRRPTGMNASINTFGSHETVQNHWKGTKDVLNLWKNSWNLNFRYLTDFQRKNSLTVFKSMQIGSLDVYSIQS